MAQTPSRGYLIFVIGGARSGKSQFALKLAAKSRKRVLFVATGQALDTEMAARIAEHKKSRPPHWRTLETPSKLADSLKAAIGDAEVVIVDCLTLLVSNVLGSVSDHGEAAGMVNAEVDSLIGCVDGHNTRFIIVSNEVGLGIVPNNELTRSYRDLLGSANQTIAARADEVYFMTAGLPLRLK